MEKMFKAKKERDNFWLDLVLLRLSNEKLLTNDDMEIIIDRLMKPRTNLKNLVLKCGHQLTDDDIKKIKKIK